MNPEDRHDTQTRKSLKAHLITLVVVSIFPVLVYAGLLVSYLSLEQLRSIEGNLKGTTRALAAAVDKQMTSTISSLKMLAMVEDFDPEKFLDLHRRLSRFVRSQPGWVSLSIAEVNGTQLFNSIMPFGATLPSWKDQAFFREVVKTEKPTISGYRVALITGNKVISVAIPVKENSRLKYILVGTIYLSYLNEFLQGQELPKNWTAAVLDKDKIIIARSLKSESFVGSQATETLSRLTQEKEDSFFEDTTQDGEESFGAFSRSPVTGWTVTLGIPAKSVRLTDMNSFWMMLSGGGLLLTLGIILAYFFSKKISVPIMALSASATALGKGEKHQMIHSGIAEVAEVNGALYAASLERDKNEETIRNLYHKAQEAVALRDTFLSIASHELKTPLTTLKLQFQVLEKNIQKSETIASESLVKPFGRVLNQVRRLTSLVDDLLDVSRITSGKLDLHLEKVLLTHLVKDIASNFEKEAEAIGVTISVEGDETIEGMWDLGRLEQIFTNLVSNALKYGNGKPVEIKVLRLERTIQVRVRDHGLGIHPDDQQKIFDQFERGQGVGSISGLGLGLWIVNRILDRMSSSITLESAVGEGSTFIVELPQTNTYS